MEIYHFLNLVLYAEILGLLFVILATLFFRFFFRTRELWLKKIKSSLSNDIIDCLQGLKPPPHQSPKLLEVLESFNEKLSGKDWDSLKFRLVKDHLLPKAKKWVKSPFWIKRNKAARIFALCPLLEDEKLMLKLIADPKFLVRSIAASALIGIESQKGVLEILKQMEKERGFSYFFYIDLLSQSSQKVLAMISQMSDYHLPALAILATKTFTIPLPFLAKDLASKDLLIRKAAIKVLIRNPQKEVYGLLLENLKDPDPEMRALAATALENYPLSQDHLESSLTDPIWSVKLAAAKSLKAMGLLKKESDIYGYVTEFE